MFFFEPIGGMYREFLGIKTILEPKDESLYRSLLPSQFAMPAQAAVTLFIADYLKVAPWPFKILPWSMTRYQEGAVSLKGVYKGVEGWLNLTMPVSSWVSMAPGRYMLGFPKYVADDITLKESNGGWHGAVKLRDVTKIQLDFTSGLQRDLASWENEILSNPAFFETYGFVFFPPEKGTRVNKVWIEEVRPAKWSPQLGMVDVNVDSNDPWAGLIDTQTAYPGMYNYFTGGNNLAAEMMD